MADSDGDLGGETRGAAGTWKLGDMVVNRLGLGAMRLTGSAAFRGSAARATGTSPSAVLRRAVELGVNHIDTAAFYFSPLRSANELINSALRPTRTIWSSRPRSGRPRPVGSVAPWARPDRSAARSGDLRQLGRDRLDLVNLRAYPVDSIAGQCRGARRAARRRLIRYLGVPSVRARAAGARPRPRARWCACRTAAASARAPQAPRVPPACGERASRSCRISPSPAGAREGADGRERDAVLAIAEAHGVTPAPDPLAWTLQQAPHVLAIPGTGNPGTWRPTSPPRLRLSPAGGRLESGS